MSDFERKAEQQWRARMISQLKDTVRDLELVKAENTRLRSCLSYDEECAREIIGEYNELREKYAEVCQTSAMLRADMAAARERQAKLREENKKLREDMEDLESYDQMLRDRLRQETELQVKAKAENAKLRELVRFMWFADYAGHFSTLPEHQEHQAAVWQRMCELGVEMDG